MDLSDDHLRRSGLKKMLDFLESRGVDLQGEMLIYLGRLATLEREPDVIDTSIRGDNSFPNYRCIVHTKENISTQRAEELLQKVGFVPFKHLGGIKGYINYIIGDERLSRRIEFISEAYSHRQTQQAISLRDIDDEVDA